MRSRQRRRGEEERSCWEKNLADAGIYQSWLARLGRHRLPGDGTRLLPDVIEPSFVRELEHRGYRRGYRGGYRRGRSEKNLSASCAQEDQESTVSRITNHFPGPRNLAN